ncbi:MAG: hypothetical protein AB1668_00995 [Nanoarchaeota archaeon]
MNNPQENPIYTLHQHKIRALLPKITALVVLSVIFYVGILLNIYLLEFDAKNETILKTFFLFLLIFIVSLSTFLSMRKASQPYKFYSKRISFGKESIEYINIINTSSHQDPFDKLFKTYSINLGNNFVLRHIPLQLQLEDYLKKLIEYAQRR